MENQAKFEHLVAAVTHDLKNQLQSLTDQQDKIINELPPEYQQEFTPMLRQTNRIKEDALRLVSLFRLEHQQQFAMDDCWPRDRRTTVRLDYSDLHVNPNVTKPPTVGHIRNCS